MLKVTTSWDDGDILDIRLSELLTKYGIKGTFYISKDYRPERLTDSDIKEIAKTHEIGAHTLTHPDLRAVSQEQKTVEISGSKKWLEEVLEKEVKIFCFPKGLYDDETVAVVKKTGFRGARTTKLGTLYNKDPFLLDTTIQIYPFPFRKSDYSHLYWKKLLEPYHQRSGALQALGVSKLSMYSWLSTAKATFDATQSNGKIFHLWGHSWEIEKYGMWKDLEKFLHYISKKDCQHVQNSELLN